MRGCALHGLDPAPFHQALGSFTTFTKRVSDLSKTSSVPVQSTHKASYNYCTELIESDTVADETAQVQTIHNSNLHSCLSSDRAYTSSFTLSRPLRENALFISHALRA